jgi:hypothetical protein
MYAKTLRWLLAIVACVSAGLLIGEAQAPIGSGQSPVVSSSVGSGFIGATGVASGPVYATDGTAALPSYSFAADPDTGTVRQAANSMSSSFGGAIRSFQNATSFVVGSGVLIGWSSGVDPFASAADITIVRAGPGELTYTAVLFANLGTPANGTVAYCSDCLAQSNPCTGASTGAFARRLNGAWDCR